MPDIIEIPLHVAELMAKLSASGFQAHIVGGCVRDSLMKRKVHDWDITTDARPEEMKIIFSGHKTIETGIRHGTLTVLWDDESYEITAYRTDGIYSDSRHPDSVSFTSLLSEDLARRDFTINAMAYVPGEGLTDLFDGKGDIERRVIRTVGSSEKRLTEDALRILRALRFASVLDFSVERETEKALFSLSGRLSAVSRERVREEFVKLISGTAAASVIAKYGKILCVALAFLPSPTRLCELSEKLSTLPEKTVIRLTYLLCDSTPQQAKKQLAEARFDKKTVYAVVSVLSVWQLPPPKTHALRQIRRGEFGLSACLDACLLWQAQGYEEAALWANTFSEDEKKGVCCRVSELAVSGNDLLCIGIAGGKEIGATMSRLLSAVINGKVKNKKSALLSFLITERNFQCKNVPLD